jgi:hypothetical protein
MEPAGGTKTRRATIVRFAPDRQIHIAEEFASTLRSGAIERTADLYDQYKEVWKVLDPPRIAGQDDLTTEQREQFGALFYIASGMANQLNDLLHLSEHAEQGWVPPNERHQAHEYNTRASG